MIEIRKIKYNDKEIYVNFCKDFYNMDAVLHTIPCENFEKTFELAFKDTTYLEIFMIDCNNESIGYLLLSKTYSQEVAGKVLLIEELYIKPEYRSKGIGTNVFDFIFKNFKEYTRYRLEVTDANKSAIKLYEKLGFSNLEYKQMVMEDF